MVDMGVHCGRRARAEQGRGSGGRLWAGTQAGATGLGRLKMHFGKKNPQGIDVEEEGGRSRLVPMFGVHLRRGARLRAKDTGWGAKEGVLSVVCT